MGDFKSFYPEFVPNQILTNTQLNQLREHLDLEQRRGLVRLSGAGIVCGLAWRGETAAGKHSIRIDPGYGVSSDGYLVELCAERVCTHWRDYRDPDVDEEQDPRYGPWQKSGDRSGQKDIRELVEAERMAAEEPPEGARELRADTADGRVLVLYLEKEAVDLNSCLVTTCDNKGFNINLNVRALLVKREDLEALPECLAAPEPVRIPRLHKQKALADLAGAAELNDAYGQIVADRKGALATAIANAFARHGRFLDLGGPDIAALVAASPLAGAPDQYRYDALRDLAQAHNEAAAAAHNLVAPCCPEHDFPRHLQLGDAAGSLRHRYYPAAARNVTHGHLERARGLMLRVTEMLGRLRFDAPAEVSVAASHGEAHPLGRRALPFYFPGLPEAKWSPPAPCAADGAWPWRGSGTAPTLDSDYNPASFLRIEGHVGKKCDDAAAAIRTRRHQHNVEFDLLCTYFADTAAEEQALAKEAKALLKARAELLAKAKEMVEGLVAAGSGKPEDLAKAANAFAENQAKLARLAAEWKAVRARRRLQCDLGPLEQEYLAVRGEIACACSRLYGVLARLAGNVARLKDEEMTGRGLEKMLEGAGAMLVDRMVASLAAAPAAWQKPPQFPFDLVPEELPKLSPGAQLRLALLLAIDALARAARRLLEESLPKALPAFHPGLFARRHREIARDLLQLWLWLRSLGLPAAGLTDGSVAEGGDAPLDAAEEGPVIRDLLGVALACAPARLATLHASLEEIRARDLSLFANLALRVDGLEHLAGVEKGGTFILVCDKPGPQGKAVADFSLGGRLPCCCALDPAALCLPPVAVNDHRVVILQPDPEGKGYRPVSIAIVVSANDLNLNVDAKADKPKAAVETLSDATALGATIEADEEKGVVRYTLDNPRPGLVDYFPYRLRLDSGECRGEDIGHVVVALRVAPDLTGNIAGEVHGDAGGASAPGATVTISETGATAIADAKGRFAFAGIEARAYTLQARLGDRSSPAQAVTVRTGETARVALVLSAAPVTTGSLLLRVRDETGEPLPGARVLLTDLSGAAVRDAATDAAGNALLRDLDAGPYNVRALLAGFESYMAKVMVTAGTVVPVDLVLKAVQAIAPWIGVRAVADATGVGLVEAANLTKNVYATRYADRAAALEAASQDPKILTSDPYKTAAGFLYETVSNPAKSDAEVAAAYEAAATPLAAAAKRASGAERAAYQEMLAAASLAYMDRVALANPTKLSPEATAGMGAVSASLKEGGVSADEVRTRWGSEELKNELGVKTTATLGRLVG